MKAEEYSKNVGVDALSDSCSVPRIDMKSTRQDVS